MSPKKFNITETLENKINFVFKDKKLLHLALLHRSYLNENSKETESNERLEFLGDAVLEYVVSENLFRKFQTQDEGHLTALRSKLVNTTALSKVAETLNLGQELYLSRGEEKSGGRQNKALLANTTEALIGAIFLDQGIGAAGNFIAKYILTSLDEVVKHSLKDPKSILQEYVQAKGYPAPRYKSISEVGPDHAKLFTVQVFLNNAPYAQGVGPSKQIAAQMAAEEALKLWAKQSP